MLCEKEDCLKYSQSINQSINQSIRMQQQPSTEEELGKLYPKYTDEGFTWEAFGNCSEVIITGIEAEWFPDSAAKRIKLESIWVRHPIRQQPGKVMQHQVVIYFLSVTPFSFLNRAVCFVITIFF